MSALSILASNHDEYITGDIPFIQSFNPETEDMNQFYAELLRVYLLG